uniref:Uncharacterized protein n=1 Tax=viral metagenome TaxID=1070528 RepID=A0A6C0B1L5_9ZZZZ
MSLDIINITKLFKNKIIKKIVNIYQPNYANGNAPGFGDYLRGCFCLMQISAMLGLEFDIDLNNHPISQYIVENSNHDKAPINYDNIWRYQNINYKTDANTFLREFIDYLNNVREETHYLFSSSFPVIVKLSPVGKKLMQTKIKPNKMMEQNIKLRMTKLAIRPKGYCTIHIRSGDTQLLGNNKIINGTFFSKIRVFLSSILNPANKYIILSDSNELKLLIKAEFPNCVAQVTEITHLGETGNHSDRAIMYTMLDFYIMASSNKIISISNYEWGSGFSQWCSAIYNIPLLKFVVT